MIFLLEFMKSLAVTSLTFDVGSDRPEETRPTRKLPVLETLRRYVVFPCYPDALCLTLSKLKLRMTYGLLSKAGKHIKTLSKCMCKSSRGISK